MIDIQISNVDSFINNLRQQAKSKRAFYGRVASGLGRYAFNILLARSAQSTTKFVVNWNYRINTEDSSVSETSIEYVSGGHLMGGQRGISEALQRNAPHLSRTVQLGDVINITNAVDYAQAIEEGSVNFRQGNQGAPVGYTFSLLGAEYGVINENDQLALAGRSA